MKSFLEFVDKRTRESKKQLDILKRVLEKGGMSVVDFSEEEDPHLFLKGSKNLSFEGVRIYKIGGEIVFRVQKEENTHPYGKAYSLQVEEMYDDILSDEMDEEKAGKEVIKSISEEMRKFFNRSDKAEKEIRSIEFGNNNDSMGSVLASSTGTDYANQIKRKNKGI